MASLLTDKYEPAMGVLCSSYCWRSYAYASIVAFVDLEAERKQELGFLQLLRHMDTLLCDFLPAVSRTGIGHFKDVS